MEVGFKTDKGKKRSNNEDACFVMIRDKVFIIADGVGGNKSGEIASRTAVNEVAKYVEDNPLDKIDTSESIARYFNECIKSCNLKIIESSRRFEENRGMATTLVIGYLHNRKIYIFNIGDSRAYYYRDNQLKQITVDHTYVNSLVEAGLISKAEAEIHENKNMITRAVGAEYAVEADEFQLDIKKDDIILMCTDGLYGEVPDEEIIDVLKEENAMGEKCRKLIDMANENGGNDNITIICLKITEDEIHE